LQHLKHDARQAFVKAGAALTVLVADAMPLVADALRLALAGFDDLNPIDECPASGLDLIDAAVATKAQMVLVDYWMPDMEGAAATRLILAQRPECKVIVMSWFYGTREIENSLDAGAVGFFPKTLKVERLADGLRRAQAGESPVFLDELEKVFRNLGKRSAQASEVWAIMKTFTTRELAVISLLGTDMSVEDVAKFLKISPNTVRVHMHNLVVKAKTGSYREVILMARQCGVIRG